MPRLVLLGLLGAAAVAAVGSLPVEYRKHNEEMVTRCIVQVLANVLLQPNAPPISPICRYALKKSAKEVMDEEKNENENAKFEVRLLRDPADASAADIPSSREEAGAPGEGDAQSLTTKDKEKWPQGGRHSGERAGAPQETPYPSDGQDSKEATPYHSEKGAEEDREEEEGEKYQKREHGGDGSEETHLENSGETQNTFLNKKNQATAKNKEALVGQYDRRAVGRSEEETHSRERSSQESGEEVERGQEKHSQEASSQSRSQEDSEESEEDAPSEVAKRRLRPRHHHGRSRPDRSSQEGKPPPEARSHSPEEPEEAKAGKAHPGEERSQHPAHHRASEEEPEYGEEGRNYPGVQAPANLEGGRFAGRREAYEAPRPHSAARQEEGDKRGRPRSEPDPRLLPARGEGGEGKAHERGKGPHHRGGGGEPDPTEEERVFGDGHHHMQEGRTDKARRHPQLEWKGQDRDDLHDGERNGEGGAPTWQQQGVLQDSEESSEDAGLQDRAQPPRRSPERRGRPGEPLGPRHGPPQWKSSGRFERKDDTDDSFLEGEEENGLTLNERHFFPEYSYDWWEKKPSADDANWGHEKRSLARTPELDPKRQYDSVAELDQLLHYRKKSAEFPDLYESEEQLSTPHSAEEEKEKDGVGQRVLTEEEEKKLENLAAMDLELQKIAEKLSGNRKG